MPRLPTYDGPQVLTEPARAAFIRTPDVSSGAQALARGLGDMAEGIDRAQLRIDEADASNAVNELNSRFQQWDAAQRNSYQGRKAADYAQAAADWWKENTAEFGKALSPRAQSLAGRALQRNKAAYDTDVARFVANEMEKHAVNEHEAALMIQAQTGVTTGDLTGAAANIRESVARFGSLRGWSTEQVQAQQLKALSTMHLAWITKLTQMDGGVAQAQAYYTANKAEIDKTVQPRVEEVIKVEGLNQAARANAASWAALPLPEQIAMAGEIKDPALREKTLTEVRNNYALVREAERERQRAASDAAWQLYAQRKPIPETVLGQMDGKDRAQLQDSIDARANRLSEGREVKTNWNTYVDLRNRTAAGEKIDLRAYTEKLAGPQIEQLLDLQNAQAKLGVQDVATFEQQLSAAGSELGLKGERLGQFKARAQDLIIEKAKRDGKPPTDEQRAELLRWLSANEITQRQWLWDKKTPRYQLPRDEVLSKAPLAPAAPAIRIISVTPAGK